MVTDSIEIETKHIVKDSRAYRWKSTGEDTFTIEEIERGNTGTKIYFKLSDEHKHFAEPDTVKRILKKYSNFVDFPIYVNGEIVNTVSAIWHKKKEEVKEEEANEFYSFISGDYNKTLGYLHFSVEGNINLEAMLFIPEKAADLFFREENEHGLQLYSGKVFISDKINELLPDYLKFIRGVVDTVDLPLNVSRELTQSTPLTAKIRNILTGKILTFLEEWSVENAVKYRKFFDSFGSLLKIGLNTDFDNKNRILELMRYDSTFLNNNEKTTLKDYVSRMKENQKHIYYIIGENREQILKNPNMEYFLKNNIEILILTDPADYITFPYIASYESFNIQSIERAGIDLESEPTNEEELNPETTQSLIQFIKEVLSTEIEDVVASKRLVDSPVTLVVGEKGFDPQMEKIMQQIDKSFTGSKRILEINTSHPLIKNIWRLYIADTNHDFLRKTVQHLYEGALIIEGLLKNPNDYIQRANEILLKATDIN